MEAGPETATPRGERNTLPEKRKASETAIDRGRFIMNLDCFMKLNTQLYERATLQEIEPMNYEPQISSNLSS